MKIKTIINMIIFVILIALLIGVFNYILKNKDSSNSIIDNIIGGISTTSSATTTALNPATVITKNSDSLRWTFISNGDNTKLLYGFVATLKPNTNYQIVYSVSPYITIYGEEYEGGVGQRAIFEVDFSGVNINYRIDPNSSAMIQNMSNNYMNDIIQFKTDINGNFEFYIASQFNDGQRYELFTGTEAQIQFHKQLALLLKNSDLALSIIEVGE